MQQIVKEAGGTDEEVRLAGIHGFAYPLYASSRWRVTPRSALVVLALILVGAGALAFLADEYGEALAARRDACLQERTVARQEVCLRALTTTVTSFWSPLRLLVVAGFVAGFVIAIYVAVALVRLMDERRKHHAAMLAEARLGRLEAAFVEGDVTPGNYDDLRKRLLRGGALEARGDDMMQAGRVARAVALYVFPLSLLPVLALAARAWFPAGPAGGAAGLVQRGAETLTSNPLLANPILELTLRPVLDVAQEADGRLDVDTLVSILAPILLVVAAAWVFVAVGAAVLLSVGRQARERWQDEVDKTWRYVLLAARDRRRGLTGHAPLEDDLEGHARAA